MSTHRHDHAHEHGAHDEHGHDHNGHQSHAGHDSDHDHGHGHAHGHDHAHAYSGDNSRAFAIGVTLNLMFVVLETGFGVTSHSMALLSDAGHNLSDVLALALSWGAAVLSRREPSTRFTYGLGSSSILAALLNAMVLMLVVGGIAWQAILRLSSPVAVGEKTIMWVAAVGIVVNGATALLFMKNEAHDLNVRGAFLHMAGDALVSLGVVLAGAAMLYTGWLWLDPAVSLVVSALIIVGTWGLLRDSLALTLHAVPPRIDADRIRGYLAGLDGVAEVHDLHIWGMSTTESALTAHLVMPGGAPGNPFIARVDQELRQRFHIDHATLQLETGDPHYPCPLAPESVV